MENFYPDEFYRYHHRIGLGPRYNDSVFENAHDLKVTWKAYDEDLSHHEVLDSSSVSATKLVGSIVIAASLEDDFLILFDDMSDVCFLCFSEYENLPSHIRSIIPEDFGSEFNDYLELISKFPRHYSVEKINFLKSLT